jgi:hypothetical protein
VSPTDSDETIFLPDRFDKYGRKKPEKGEDLLADKLEELLSGKGSAGQLLKGLFGESSGGSRRKKSVRD